MSTPPSTRGRDAGGAVVTLPADKKLTGGEGGERNRPFLPLSSTLTRDRIPVRLVWRGVGRDARPVAVYRCEAGNFQDPARATFDVFFVQEAPAETLRFPGKPPRDVPARERYPSAEAWGVEGWSPVGMEAVRARLLAMGVGKEALP